MRWRPRSLHGSVRTVRTQAKYEFKSRQGYEGQSHTFGSATPRQLVQYLDDFVIGQENAKKVLSVAIYNHYNRVRANLTAFSQTDDYDAKSNSQPVTLLPHPHRTGFSPPLDTRSTTPISYEKSNVLMIGPTGSGKTLLARTLAKVLDVPFSVSDATAFTQAGYVGEDVDMCVYRLLQAAHWDVHRASYGIVYVDEIDKLSKRSSGSTSDGTRDVGGEGVQQALLRMMEGSVITIQAKGSVVEGPNQSQTTSSIGSVSNVATGEIRRNRSSLSPGPTHDLYQIDTSNVLFIFSGAFVGLENVTQQRLAKGSIGFTADLADDNKTSHIPFFTPNGKQVRHYLELVEPPDLVKYGFIPEFVSRLPTITTLLPLEIADLFRILTEVNGSLVSQYTALFGYSGVEIRFTSAALREICRKAYDRGGGARGLKAIMEHLLLDAMYEVPGSGIRHVLINESVARGSVPALYWSRGEGAAFWAAWADEESKENVG